MATSLRKGGTWAGAEEELKREQPRPVYVRVEGDVPNGNEALLELGAQPFPEPTGDLDDLLVPTRAESIVADAPERKPAEPLQGSLFSTK